MASTTGVSQEIHSVRTVSGNQPLIRALLEDAAQTFLAGTPVFLDSTGYLAAVGTDPRSIVGFSLAFGNNLTTDGVALQPSFGSVPYQTAAVNLLRPYFNDGRSYVEMATTDTIFYGQVGTSVSQANVGISYGITKDTDGHWYIDLAKTTGGTNTVATIVEISPYDLSATPRGVFFTLLPAVIQMAG
jgi:hypothetical protein